MKLQFESQVRRASARPLIKKTGSSGHPRQGDHQGQTFYKHFLFVRVLRKIAKHESYWYTSYYKADESTTEIANQLWKDLTNSLAKFDPTTVIKDW